MWLRLLPLAGAISSVDQLTYRRVSRFLLRRGGVHIDGLPLWISPRTFLDVSGPGSITIGDRTVISHYVRILTHDFSLDRVAERLGNSPGEGMELYRAANVHIGSHVFLGLGVTVMPGVRIGDGAVVAANALVTRNVDSDSVVAGAPARFVSTTSAYFDKNRSRFSVRSRRR